MTFSPRLLFLSLALLAARAGLSATELPPAWPTRLAALAAPRTITAGFTESRYTPLKKRPVVVTGTVRIDRALGLSLAYDQPRAPVVILDAKGLLLRHADGHEQSAPPEAEPDLRLLHALFAFDLPALEKTYSLAVSETPDGAWTMTFTRLPEAAAGYRELTLVGEAARLTAIHLTKTAKLHTDIALAPPQLDPVFTAEELARYFR
jgi:hypothetical protein